MANKLKVAVAVLAVAVITLGLLINTFFIKRHSRIPTTPIFAPISRVFLADCR